MQQTSMQEKNNLGKQRGGISMFKKMKHMKNEKGLTLIELLAVIVILAIIAAIAIPAIGNIINNTRDKAVLSDIQSALSAAKIARADGSCTSPCTGAQFEFSSSKIANATVTPQGGGAAVAQDYENISIDFSGSSPDITVTLAGDFSGTKIPTAITTQTNATVTKTTRTFTISEEELNKVLGN
jgi:type IV pilus assembly protein PilA